MYGSIRGTLAAIGLTAGFFAFSTAASAGCLQGLADSAPTLQEEGWLPGALPTARLMPVDWREHHQDEIVGFWNIVVTSKGNPGIPDGQVLDYGLQQWHGDGTEFTNSEMQHPLTQNYCLGAWERTGEKTYKLNHFAYNYDTAQNPTGLVRIVFEVKVKDDGEKFTGTYVINLYDKMRNHLQTINCLITGKRITVDTTAQQVL